MITRDGELRRPLKDRDVKVCIKFASGLQAKAVHVLPACQTGHAVRSLNGHMGKLVYKNKE